MSMDLPKAAEILSSAEGSALWGTDERVEMLLAFIAEDCNTLIWRNFLHEYAMNDLGACAAAATKTLDIETLVREVGWTPSEMLSMSLEFVDSLGMAGQFKEHLDRRYSNEQMMIPL